MTLAGTGDLSNGDAISITIGNTTFTSTAGAADDLNDIGADLTSQINAAGITGFTASFSAVDPDDEAATITISNASTDAGDVQAIAVSAVDTNGDQISGAVGEISIAGLSGAGDITANATFADGAIVAGEEYTITVGTDDFTYTALAGDDLNDATEQHGNVGDADTVIGGLGEDTLVGDMGDILTGSDGIDNFVIQFDDAATAPGAVTVTDFDYASNETLLLRDADGTPYTAEELEATLEVSSVPFADNDTILTYNGEVIAILEHTDPESLAEDTSWIANFAAGAPIVAQP